MPYSCVHACRLQRLQCEEAVRLVIIITYYYWPVEQGYTQGLIRGDLTTKPRLSLILPSTQAKGLVDASFSTDPF